MNSWYPLGDVSVSLLKMFSDFFHVLDSQSTAPVQGNICCTYGPCNILSRHGLQWWHSHAHLDGRTTHMSAREARWRRCRVSSALTCSFGLPGAQSHSYGLVNKHVLASMQPPGSIQGSKLGWSILGIYELGEIWECRGRHEGAGHKSTGNRAISLVLLFTELCVSLRTASDLE